MVIINMFNAEYAKNRENPLFYSGGGLFLYYRTIEWLYARSGLYSFISNKSAVADEKRTLDTKPGSFTADGYNSVALQYKQEKKTLTINNCWNFHSFF